MFSIATKIGTFKAFLTLTMLLLATMLAGCASSTDSEEDLGELSESLCTGVKVVATPPGPQNPGTSVVLSASGATCAAGETPEYRFVYIKEGTSTPVQIRGYGTAPSTAWSTVGLASGSYQVIVYARAVGSTVASQSYAYLTPNYLIGNVCNNLTSFTMSPASPQAVGTTIALTAAATCTGGTAEYRFAYRAPGTTNFVSVGPFGAATQNWNTAGLPAGAYTLIVYARAVGNTSTSESLRYGSFQLGSVCSGATISAAPPSPQPVGTMVTLTGTATCSAPQFRFSYRLNGSSPWIPIGSFGSAMQGWDTTGLASGVYNLLVEARQTGSSGGAETSAVITNYAIGSTCGTVTLAASPPSPSAIGTMVTLTGTATCSGGATAEYRFRIKGANDAAYTTLRDYAAGPATWDTSTYALGAYALLVEARAVGSSGPAESTSAVLVYQLTALALTQASAGLGNHVCARVSDGSARCWGANDVGQLGNGTTSPSSSSPVTVSGLTTVAAVASGGFHSCALLTDNTVRCWGQNSDGQLGNNSTTPSSSPVVVTGLTDAVAISAGTFHTCALRSGGGINCWGNNSYLQTGTTTTVPRQLVATPAAGVTGASAVVAGGFHTCALVSGGLKCWGDNSLGQLGNGGTPNESVTAVDVPGLTSGVTSVGSGDSHVCAVVGGAVQCWGDNTYGQLGDGTTSATPTLSPAPVPGLSGVADVRAGFVFTCARMTNNTVRCWGRNVEGELGDGTGVDKLTPTLVSGITTATALTTGSLNACASLANGTTRCWGYGAFGALGNGSTGDALSPVAVAFP
jgi:alpha-tubulin suppressor-like RCC1 family protein